MGEFITNIAGQKITLSSEKAIYWEQQNALIVSDLHLGKAGHFRKAGLAVPSNIHLGDLARLGNLIAKYQPKQVIFLGDLFHSEYNIDWDYFCKWVLLYNKIDFILVKGNHDILYKTDYLNAGLVLTDEILLDNFSLTHEKINTAYYNLSGHIHPSVRLIGNARQGLNLPCFYFSDGFGYLPAFGVFTGFVSITPKKKDHVFVVAEDNVLKI